MVEFNKIEFGNKLREARLKKNYTLKYVGKVIGKDLSTVRKYETGEVIPNAKVLNKLCDVLDIYYGELYTENTQNIVNIENSINPFKVNRLYLYYLSFKNKAKTQIETFKLIIDLEEKKDFVEAKISYGNKVILIGHIISDSFIATIRTENYKPNRPRLETNQIILDISGGTNGLVRGMMFCTDDKYVPTVKKVVVSKKEVTKDDKQLLEYFELDTTEKKLIQKTGIWQANISRDK